MHSRFRLSDMSFVVVLEAPEAPIDLSFDNKTFSWRSQRQKSFVKDVLEWVPYFAETDVRSSEGYSVYTDTTMNLPIVSFLSAAVLFLYISFHPLSRCLNSPSMTDCSCRILG